MAHPVQGLAMTAVLLLAVSAGCGGRESSTADETICRAIAAVDADSTADDAKRAVERIKGAGIPADDALTDVRNGVSAFENQLGLAVDIGRVSVSCARVGVDLDVPLDG